MDGKDQQEWEAPGRQLADAPGSPWRTLAAREAYRNRWFTVTEYQVIRPDRQPGIYGVVDPGDNATIVALDAEDRALLVSEFLYPLQTYAWKLPSGMVERGEDAAAAARRELSEEAGLEADNWTPLGNYYLSAGIARQTSYIYLARGLRAFPTAPEGTEQLTLRPVPLAEARAMCLRNEIRDAPSVLGLWRAWEWLRNSQSGD
jgi:8-oxo-dGTP pyrophosphatase MutT (NUDIX family)